MNIRRVEIESYLAQYWGQDTQLLSLGIEDDRQRISTKNEDEVLTLFAQGHPMLVTYLEQDEQWQVVLQTSAAMDASIEDQPGSVHFLVDYDTHDDLPQHTPALDIGVLTAQHGLVSLADEKQFFVMTQHMAGTSYVHDLQWVGETGEATTLDLQRVEQLAIYLAEIHATKHDNPLLYQRHIRDMIGKDEGVMDLADSYPDNLEIATPRMLKRLEQKFITWRWRLKEETERLSAIHGNFQPFNVLFEDTIHFQILGRGHNRWGEPADDVAAMAMNYLFYGLRYSAGTWEEPFEALWDTFWDIYDVYSDDDELVAVVGPFLAQRALAFASPACYIIAQPVRNALLYFAQNVMAEPQFEPHQVKQYIKQSRVYRTFVDFDPKLHRQVDTKENADPVEVAGMRGEDGWTPIWSGSHVLDEVQN